MITDGTTQFTAVYKKSSFKGMIVAFSGRVDHGYPIDADTGIVRKDWHICDGNNGTPDLRDRFIVGSGGSYTAGAIGGEANHTITIAEMPAHDHAQNINGTGHDDWNDTYGHAVSNPVEGGSLQGYTYEVGTRTDGTQWSDHSVSRVRTDNTGGNKPHNNLPPYYALTFIMKL